MGRGARLASEAQIVSDRKCRPFEDRTKQMRFSRLQAEAKKHASRKPVVDGLQLTRQVRKKDQSMRSRLYPCGLGGKKIQSL